MYAFSYPCEDYFGNKLNKVIYGSMQSQDSERLPFAYFNLQTNIFQIKTKKVS